MNGEMDFMILNNKVKGVQGAVDNIDTKIDSVATKENIQEVKTLIENSGGGDALESTSQEILEKIESVEDVHTNYTYTASSTVLKTLISSEITSKKTSSNKAVSGEGIARIHVLNGSGTLRISVSLKGASTSYGAYLYVSYNGGTPAAYATSGTFKTSYATETLDIPVCKGDKLTFHLITQNASNAAYCNLLNVCGTKTVDTAFQL